MKKIEIKSMNEDLYDDFFVEEIENRLETDPLSINGLFNFAYASEDQAVPYCFWKTSCDTEYDSCVWE